MKETLHIYDGFDIINRVEISLETGKTYAYGDFRRYEGEVSEDLKKSLFIIPTLMTGSDYVGDMVTISNHRSFLKMFKEVEGIYNLKGGFNTYAIAIRLDVAESHEEVKEVLDGLEEYPLIDKEDLSELEMEAEDKAMNKMLEDELYDFTDIEEFIPHHKDILENKEIIQNIAWEGIEELYLTWHHELDYACLGHEDISKLKTYIEDKLIFDYYEEEQIPLLINRKWSCEKYEALYNKKFHA
jgi:hypothetical protein